MLFKVVDHNNKFVQYTSLCISEEDLKNSVFFNSNISPKLRAVKSGIFSSVINCSYNQYTYKVAPIKIECYIENAFNPYYLDEILSSKRAHEIISNKPAPASIWQGLDYSSTTGWTTSATTTMAASNYITFTYTYTQNNTVNTTTVRDGYNIRNVARQ